jgi:hypothetical protein
MAVESEARGHYRTVGGALAAFGVVCLAVTFAVTFVVPQDLGFIEPSAMALISGITLVLGGWMVTAGGLSD